MKAYLVILIICIITISNDGLVERLVHGENDTDIPRKKNLNKKSNYLASKRVTIDSMNPYHAINGYGKSRIVNYRRDSSEFSFPQSAFDGSLCPTGTSRADDGTCVYEE